MHRAVAEQEVGPARVETAKADAVEMITGCQHSAGEVPVAVVDRLAGSGETLMPPILPKAPLGNHLAHAKCVRQPVGYLRELRAPGLSGDNASGSLGIE